MPFDTARAAPFIARLVQRPSRYRRPYRVGRSFSGWQMIEVQRRVVRACVQAHLWDWVPVGELWDGDEAAEAIPKAVAKGWLVYDEARHAVRTTIRGLPGSPVHDWA